VEHSRKRLLIPLENIRLSQKKTCCIFIGVYYFGDLGFGRDMKAKMKVGHSNEKAYKFQLTDSTLFIAACKIKAWQILGS
jgi:hypothetical protein